MNLSGQIYICRAGETWDSIALKVYGNEKYACELLNANPSLSSIPIFVGKEVLKLPVVEMPEDVEDDEMEADEYMPAKAPWKE